MKICIIIISTLKKYNSFAELLIKSIRQNFLCECKPSILLIGDDSSIISKNDHFFQIEGLPKPLTTLLRYNYFLKVKDIIKNYDIIYYMDADLEVIKTISLSDITPDSIDQYVVVNHHWEGYCKINGLESNKKSTAYLESIENYYQACFYGSYTQSFLNLIDYGNEMINEDLKNNIIAKWHDESHFNKYMINRDVKVLSSNYAYPSFETINEDVMMIHHNAQIKS